VSVVPRRGSLLIKGTFYESVLEVNTFDRSCHSG
jgi:hypothetical protein